MKVALFDHNGKARLLGEALDADSRFELATAAPEVILADTDHPHSPPVPHKHRLIKRMIQAGGRLCLYPHGANPQLDYDGLRPLHLPVWLQLVPGEGHREIYRRIGHPVRCETVGFSFCELGVASTNRPEHYLFAPIHPWADGKRILDVHGALNHQAYEAFRHLPGRKTVRMWGEDIPNGIFDRQDDIDYVQANLGAGEALQAIDTATHVLGYGTFAYMALARGKPVVMFGGDTPVMNDEGTRVVAHWDAYKDYLRYPVDVADGPLAELFELAATSRVDEWKELFVGGPFQPERFLDLVEGLRPSRADRRRLARR